MSAFIGFTMTSFSAELFTHCMSKALLCLLLPPSRPGGCHFQTKLNYDILVKHFTFRTKNSSLFRTVSGIVMKVMTATSSHYLVYTCKTYTKYFNTTITNGLQTFFYRYHLHEIFPSMISVCFWKVQYINGLQRYLQ